MFYLNYFLIFYFGAIVGSFLNVVILRLPKEEKITGRSHCSDCRHRLGPLDLLPLFSYLFLRGKCRYCSKKISPRYFIIEALAGLLFALASGFAQPLLSLPDYLMLVKSFAVVAVLIAVFVIDFEHYLILDEVIFSGAVLMVILNAAIGFTSGSSLAHNLLQTILQALLAAAPFYLLWFFSKGKWIGFGDVKFAFFIGAVFLWPLWVISLMLSVFIGGAFSCGLLLAKKKSLKSRIPFGTFLSLGCLLTLFFGQRLLDWYLSLLGF